MTNVPFAPDDPNVIQRKLARVRAASILAEAEVRGGVKRRQRFASNYFRENCFTLGEPFYLCRTRKSVESL